MFKKAVLCAGVGALLASSSAVFAAEDVDMAEYSCDTLIQEITADPEAANSIMWFMGYTAGMNNSLTLDIANVAPFFKQVATVCAQNPNMKVLEVVEQMSK